MTRRKEGKYSDKKQTVDRRERRYAAKMRAQAAQAAQEEEEEDEEQEGESEHEAGEGAEKVDASGSGDVNEGAAGQAGRQSEMERLEEEAEALQAELTVARTKVKQVTKAVTAAQQQTEKLRQWRRVDREWICLTNPPLLPLGDGHPKLTTLLLSQVPTTATVRYSLAMFEGDRADESPSLADRLSDRELLALFLDSHTLSPGLGLSLVQPSTLFALDSMCISS